eukprot:TRINITY_DN1230_c0_g1_i1.p1 TRINITY_DN1230_c0_g1~~TRINITY_DN1230_c0_g1_i1.p1  ORF type:complete len:464 (+),score=121.21 TRINITY_DN1230_c0_g1_i1:772-2163(+)
MSVHSPRQQINRSRSNNLLVNSLLVNCSPVFSDNVKVDEDFEARLNVLDELLNTEKTYLEDLEILVNKFKAPLIENKLVTEGQAVKIFSNVGVILNFHQELYEELRKKISDPTLANEIESCVTKIFSDSVEMFKSYVSYSINYVKALRIIKEMCQKDNTIKEFLENISNEQNNLRMIDFLIKPIQRLCKYPLIFRELLKHTPNDHQEYQFMTETMNQLQEVTNHVNECNLKAESQQKLQDLQPRITGFIINDNRERKFFFEDIFVIVTDKEKGKNRTAFLFNDVILITRYKNKKWHTVNIINIDSILLGNTVVNRDTNNNNVENSSSSSSSPGSGIIPRRKKTRSKNCDSNSNGSGISNFSTKFSFEVIIPKTTTKILFFCTSEEIQSKWTSKIEECLNDTKNVVEMSLSIEEQLNREKEARKKLQLHNEELQEKIVLLQKKLDQEIKARKLLEEKIKKKKII